MTTFEQSIKYADLLIQKYVNIKSYSPLLSRIHRICYILPTSEYALSIKLRPGDLSTLNSLLLYKFINNLIVCFNSYIALVGKHYRYLLALIISIYLTKDVICMSLSVIKTQNYCKCKLLPI